MNYSMIILLILMFVAMYFFTVRPQKKQQEKRAEMLQKMKKGDSIVTIGGMKGKIDEIDMEAKEVVIDVDGVFLTFDIAAIRQVNNSTATPTQTTPVEEKNSEKIEEKVEDTEKVSKEETTEEK
ncbi:preprotein translocase subunit YajC [Companilactobacillus sp. DQM5]|uniref:preprotein translocase subunit YajC n=1 Tax=Companilactobacillus sp. DQM5 TaxID=3463359 RepID=UPI0040591EF1